MPATAAGSGVRKLTVCGGGAERQRVVYTSTTHRVDVGIAPNDDITGNGPYFVFKYEGTLTQPTSPTSRAKSQCVTLSSLAKSKVCRP